MKSTLQWAVWFTLALLLATTALVLAEMNEEADSSPAATTRSVMSPH